MSGRNRVFVVGVGMTKFEKPGGRDWDYPDVRAVVLPSDCLVLSAPCTREPPPVAGDRISNALFVVS